MSQKDVNRQRAQKQQKCKVIGSKLSPYDVILKPVFTEKTYYQKNNQNKYVFKVHKDSNKNDVKAAIKEIYGYKPKKVNIVNVPYKGRARRSLVRREYKKAIVTLYENDRIDEIRF